MADAGTAGISAVFGTGDNARILYGFKADQQKYRSAQLPSHNCNTGIVLSCDAAKQKRIISNYGELQGMTGVARWLRKNTRSKERLLTFNPRQTACLLDYPYRYFADLSWWDIEQPLPQISREYLVKNRIDWIIISRPEAYGPLRQGLYQKMRRSDYLVQVYLETTAGGEVIAAIFKLRKERKI